LVHLLYYNKKLKTVQAWYHKPNIPAFGRLSLDDLDFKDSLSYVVRTCRKKRWRSNNLYASILKCHKPQLGLHIYSATSIYSWPVTESPNITLTKWDLFHEYKVGSTLINIIHIKNKFKEKSVSIDTEWIFNKI
jgi:hypothetical protein